MLALAKQIAVTTTKKSVYYLKVKKTKDYSLKKLAAIHLARAHNYKQNEIKYVFKTFFLNKNIPPSTTYPHPQSLFSSLDNFDHQTAQF